MWKCQCYSTTKSNYWIRFNSDTQPHHDDFHSLNLSFPLTRGKSIFPIVCTCNSPKTFSFSHIPHIHRMSFRVNVTQSRLLFLHKFCSALSFLFIQRLSPFFWENFKQFGKYIRTHIAHSTSFQEHENVSCDFWYFVGSRDGWVITDFPNPHTTDFPSSFPYTRA